MWPFTSRKRSEEDPGTPDVGGMQGFDDRHAIHYTRHAQPDPGIAAYSYDTLNLPLYTPIGGGIPNERQFLSYPSNPVVYQNQAISITTIGNPGNLAGTFVSSPLIDTSSSPGPFNAPGIFQPGEFELAGRRST